METLDSCNLCGGTRFVPFADKHGERTKQLFRIVRCEACGLVFVNPRLTEPENEALYDEAYFNGDGFDASVNYVKLLGDGDVARRGENAGVIAKIRALKGLGGRILDIGCGTGSLLKALAAAGCADLTGLELSPYAARVARESTGTRVLEGDFLGFDLGGERFDVINATEVVEHVRDPMLFFRRVKERLAPGGVFTYSTGNVESVYARVTGQRWGYLHPEGHLFYYSPATIARYFEAVGLTPLWSERTALRKSLARAEGRITHSQIMYVGRSSPGIKGLVFRAASMIPQELAGTALAAFQGRLSMPSAVNRA